MTCFSSSSICNFYRFVDFQRLQFECCTGFWSGVVCFRNGLSVVRKQNYMAFVSLNFLFVFVFCFFCGSEFQKYEECKIISTLNTPSGNSFLDILSIVTPHYAKLVSRSDLLSANLHKVKKFTLGDPCFILEEITHCSSLYPCFTSQSSLISSFKSIFIPLL